MTVVFALCKVAGVWCLAVGLPVAAANVATLHRKARHHGYAPIVSASCGNLSGRRK